MIGVGSLASAKVQSLEDAPDSMEGATLCAHLHCVIFNLLGFLAPTFGYYDCLGVFKSGEPAEREVIRILEEKLALAGGQQVG